jgi:hypothetical protein
MSLGGCEKTQKLSNTKIYNVHKNVFQCLGWNRIKKNVFSPLGTSELLRFHLYSDQNNLLCLLEHNITIIITMQWNGSETPEISVPK